MKDSEKVNTGKCTEHLGSQKKVQLAQTVLLVMAQAITGMSNSIQSTTIPEFRTRLNTSVEGLSYAMSFGSTGSFLVLPLYAVADRIGSYSALLVFFCLLWIGFWDLMKVFCTTLWAYGCCDFLGEAAKSIQGAVVTSMTAALWHEASGGPMYMMHLGYPIGTFLGPLIASPFLSQNTSETTNRTILEIKSSDNSRIELLYTIFMLITVSVALWFVPMQKFWSPKKLNGIGKKSYSWKEALYPSKWANGDAVFGIKIVMCTVFFYIFLKGALKGTSQYIVTYAVDSDLGFTNQEAAILSSVVNLMGIISRSLCIIISQYISVKTLLFTEVHAQLISGVLLVLVVQLNDRTAMYVFSCVFGFFSDTLWPVGYVFADLYVVLLSTILGVITVSTGIVDVFQTTLQGYLYEEWAIESIFYTTTIYAGLLCLLMYLMFYTTWKRPNRYKIEERLQYDNVVHNSDSNMKAARMKIYSIPEKTEYTTL